MNTDNYSYNKNLQPFAHKLRNDMTKAEACLWKYALRASMLGVPFRRQRPIANYIADFACLSLKLVIEVDGISHHFEETQIKDAKKDADLQALGYTVLRFHDEEILKDIQNVIRVIEAKIKELKEKK